MCSSTEAGRPLAFSGIHFNNSSSALMGLISRSIAEKSQKRKTTPSIPSRKWKIRNWTNFPLQKYNRNRITNERLHTYRAIFWQRPQIESAVRLHCLRKMTVLKAGVRQYYTNNENFENKGTSLSWNSRKPYGQKAHLWEKPSANCIPWLVRGTPLFQLRDTTLYVITSCVPCEYFY